MNQYSPAVLSLRPGRPEEAELASQLLHLSMGADADWFFGQEAGLATDEVIAKLYRRGGNRFGYNVTTFAMLNSQPVGLLTAYPARAMARLNLTTGRHLAGIFGLGGLLRMVKRISSYGFLNEAGRGEFYVSNLATLPDFQGRGVGSSLLAHADETARSLGLRKCSLMVAMENASARRLYERFGYRVIASIRFPRPVAPNGSAGMHRMVKLLDFSDTPH